MKRISLNFFILNFLRLNYSEISCIFWKRLPIVYTTKTTSTHAYYAWHVSKLIVLIFFSLRFKYFNRRIKMQGTNKLKVFPISILVLMEVIWLEYLHTEFESEISSQIMFVQKLYFCIENCLSYTSFHYNHRKFFFLIRCLRFVDMILKSSSRYFASLI